MKFYFKYKNKPFSAVFEKGQERSFTQEGFEDRIYEFDCEDESDAGFLYSDLENIEAAAWRYLEESKNNC